MRVLRMLVVAGFLAALAIVGTLDAAEPPPAEEAALRKVVEKLIAAIEKKDVDAYLALWTAKQRTDKGFRKSHEDFLALADNRMYGNLVFSRTAVAGDKASLRVTTDVSAIDPTTKQPFHVHVVFNFAFVKEDGAWNVAGRTRATDDLVDALRAAQTKAERAALLSREAELLKDRTKRVFTLLVEPAEKLTDEGKFAEALHLNDIAVEVAEALADPWALGHCYVNRGHVFWAQKQYEPTAENFRRALALFREAKHKRMELVTLNLLGCAYTDGGRLTEA